MGRRWDWTRTQLEDGLDPGRPRRARLEARRRLWLRLHLWLGLVAGACLAVIGLTGSALVFYMELDEALNPGLLLADPAPAGAPRLPLAAVLAATDGYAEGWRLAGVLGPRNERAAWDVWFEGPSADPAAKAVREVLVDPVNGRVHGHRDYDPATWLPPTLVGFLFLLHDALLLPWHGDTVVGLLAVLMVVSMLSGLILWWPVGGRLLAALKPRPRSTGARLNLELHRLSGVYVAAVLLAVLMSGVSMNLHDEFVWLVRRFSPAAAAPLPATSSPAEGRPMLTLDDAVRRARAAYPGGWLQGCATPASPEGVFSVTSHDVPGTSWFWSDRTITLDAYSGAILDVRDATTRRTAGDAFLDWQWPLHSGKAFGWPGRIAVFLSGLACPLLFVTGVFRWWRKRRARVRSA